MEEKEIKLLCGDTLETAYKVLLANAPAYCSFNGVRLTSSDSLEDMYKKVTGHTKEEIDAIYQKQQEERKRKEKVEAAAKLLTKIDNIFEQYAVYC